LSSSKSEEGTIIHQAEAIHYIALPMQWSDLQLVNGKVFLMPITRECATLIHQNTLLFLRQMRLGKKK